MARRRPFIFEEVFESWLKPNSQEQLQWTQNYIQNNEAIREAFDKDAFETCEEGEIPAPYPDFYIKDRLLLIRWLTWAYERYGMVIHQELERMKSAWSQKKYRMRLNQKNKQAFNFVLSKNSKQMLTALQRSYGKPINFIIDSLIEEAYRELYASSPTTSEKQGLYQDQSLERRDLAVPNQASHADNQSPKRKSQPYVDAYMAGEWQQEKRLKAKEALLKRTSNLSFEKGAAANHKGAKKQQLKERRLSRITPEG